MIQLHLEKLYRYPRILEHMWVAVPVKKARLFHTDEVKVMDGTLVLPSQTKITSRYEDGSIRFFFLRFVGNLPANAGYVYNLYLDERDAEENCVSHKQMQTLDLNENEIQLEKSVDGLKVNTGKISFQVKNYSENLFEEVVFSGKKFTKELFYGPILKDKQGNHYEVNLDEWEIVEAGKLCVILKAKGTNVEGNGGCEEGKHIKFEVKITAYAGKSWLDISYRIINTWEAPLEIASLIFAVKAEENSVVNDVLKNMSDHEKLDSTGCGDINIDIREAAGPIYHTKGISDLEIIEQRTPVERIRTCAAASNYRTDFYIGENGEEVNKIASAKNLLMESNEHMSEVFYGTFFADRTESSYGICATIYQAQQNYPKAVKADQSGLYVMLVPENVDQVIMQKGTSREQQFQLYFHDAGESLTELDNRSLIYQMPDRPVIPPEVFRQSGAVQDVFADRLSEAFEIMLIGKGDCHSRSFGMMNWGDTIDQNYTNQGRGGGAVVWSNNEYDYPHACALMYARTGIRRFLDYNMVHARHWMDVDICHYSEDPLRIGGQIEHTKGHVVDGVLVPSHQWVEGLLDYYHFTGDERGLESAIGIGENILKLLELPAYQKAGESNARETGWALRSLTALYVETNDRKWTEKCEWIVGHFKHWKEEYGNWIASYTDNTLIRTGFMTSVAVGSLMRYYRIFPSDELKELILNAVEDIRENCILDCGLFYYKELPSLSRLGNNNLLLEAMAAGYELTGDKKYLEAGKRTLIRTLKEPAKNVGGSKRIVEDAMVTMGDSTKNFAQSFYPLTVFYKYLVEADMDDFLKGM